MRGKVSYMVCADTGVKLKKHGAKWSLNSYFVGSSAYLGTNKRSPF